MLPVDDGSGNGALLGWIVSIMGWMKRLDHQARIPCVCELGESVNKDGFVEFFLALESRWGKIW